MGIKEVGFADNWIASEFPDVRRTVKNDSVANFDTVCIDVNALLHNSLRRSKNEPAFVKDLFGELDRSLRLTRPQRTVYLAVDGSAPLAKMKEQLRRRKAKAASRSAQRKGLDSAQVTPGCSFMLRVTLYLHYYAARYLEKHPYLRSLRFIVNGSETHGEGETKIMQYLNSKDGADAGLVAVFSGDSDVIVLCLLSKIENIFIVRPSSEGGEFAVLSMASLRRAIRDTDPHGRAVTDFCLLVMFSGNDYIRKLKHGSMRRVWPVYKVLRQDAKWNDRYLIKDGQFDYAVLHELMIRIRRGYARKPFKPSTTLSDETPEPDVEDSDEESDVDENYRAAYKRELNPNYTAHMPNYLQSLLWTLKMYSTGVCPDYTFSQIGYSLMPEQIIALIERDMHSIPLVVQSPDSSKALVTALCAVTLLGEGKVDLIPPSWQACFLSPAIRQYTNDMIQKSGLVNENARIADLIWHIGQEVVRLIDPSQAVVQALLYSQCPVLIANDSKFNAYLQPLGSSMPEIWANVEVRLPISTYSLRIETYTGRPTRKTYTSPITGWPFKLKPKRVMKPVAVHS